MGDFSFARDAPERLFPGVVDVALAAEESGLSSLWLMDHFHQFPPIGPATEPMPEAYVLLGGLAAATERIELGTLVTGVTYRNPALLAKMVTTLDVISGGRAWLGIGASWQESEYRAYGVGDPAAVRHKLDVLDRHCAEVGRDPAEIHRTHVGLVVVAETPAAAQAQIRAAADGVGTDPATLAAMAIASAPRRCASDARPCSRPVSTACCSPPRAPGLARA